MTILFYLLFTLLAFGQLLRISFFDQLINIYPHEIVMVVIAVFVLYKRISRHSGLTRIDSGISAGWWIPRMTESRKYLFLFIGALIITFILSVFRFTPFQNTVAFLYLLRLVFYLTFFTLLQNHDKKTLRRSLLIFTVLTIGLSFAQLVLYPNLRNLYYLGWDPHQFRLFGTMFDTTIMGIVLTVLFFWITDVEKLPYKKALQTLLVVLLLATYSRIAYLSLIIGVGYYYGLHRWLIHASSHSVKRDSNNKLIVVAGIVLFVGVIFILPRTQGESTNLTRIFTIEARVNDDVQGLQLFLKNPLFGVGYNHIKYIRNIAKDIYPNHAQANFSSSFITILVTTGIVGFAAFIYFIYDLFKRSNKLGQTVLIVVLFASLFDNVLLQNFILILTLFLVLNSTSVISD